MKACRVGLLARKLRELRKRVYKTSAPKDPLIEAWTLEGLHGRVCSLEVAGVEDSGGWKACRAGLLARKLIYQTLAPKHPLLKAWRLGSS